MARRLRDFCVVPCSTLLDNANGTWLSAHAYAVYTLAIAMSIRLSDDEWLSDAQVPLLCRRLNMKRTFMSRVMQACSRPERVQSQRFKVQS